MAIPVTLRQEGLKGRVATASLWLGRGKQIGLVLAK
jgi:hypothetical protein